VQIVRFRSAHIVAIVVTTGALYRTRLRHRWRADVKDPSGRKPSHREDENKEG
jgi:hypothetical protein